MSIETRQEGEVFIVTMNRPRVMNAIDAETSKALADAFRAFEADETSKVAILTGAEGNFSTGADLKAISRGESLVLNEFGDSVMGVPRMRMQKPVIGAIEGYAVAGGMAIAAWCDMRIVAQGATFGMPDRQKGVPILGSLTAYLPRLIGLSHALDVIMTGRFVKAEEAYRMGFANRLVEDGKALEAALELARGLASCPWEALVADRLSTIESFDLPLEIAHRMEFVRGAATFGTDDMASQTSQFAKGKREV